MLESSLVRSSSTVLAIAVLLTVPWSLDVWPALIEKHAQAV